MNMKLKFYQVLLKFSNWLIHKAFALNTFCENEIEKIQPKEEHKYININNIFAAAIGIVFILFFALVDLTPNIQDVKVPVEKKVEAIDKTEYAWLKKHYTWLNVKNYNMIYKKCEKKNIDRILYMSIAQKE